MRRYGLALAESGRQMTLTTLDANAGFGRYLSLPGSVADDY
jgi:hypothetical protein